MRKILLLVAACALAIVIAPTARAHGDLEGAFPKPGSKLGKPPRHLKVEFSQALKQKAAFKVVDGCKDDLTRETFVTGRTGHIFLQKGGSPGRWKVFYRVVSAEDGHVSKGSYRLRVEGKKDCGEPENGAGEQPGDGGTGPGDGRAAPAGGEVGGEPFPVVPVGLGALGLVAVGLLIRRVAR